MQEGLINSGEAVAIESAHVILSAQGKDTGPRDHLVAATPRATSRILGTAAQTPTIPVLLIVDRTTPHSPPTTSPSTCFGRRIPCNICNPYSEDRRAHRSTSSASTRTGDFTSSPTWALHNE